ncbi:enoyl-CoA hydratase/isomerase family protein [Pseudomaricurvus alkylphenolicus]|jgi:enoyl-CoA hydratase/carnithine racemase|uniref:enoyl-CoA hydratase/isomerase family protein n=1 Tax=Pseudomaricurvus alkylphenolicus TaxID=1306991 RepID=UPI00141E97EC|nr:enoyl-CoA hydratase/isomerase family protein [Pseudomaricurvus alkylphenolicus]NIB38923.1 enoyl-CoA hydratase/isomerase family protein [Pseudomaricurvus alkylphenolicus]
MDTVIYDKHDKVGVITLNRPAHHNAFNLTMMNELDQIWKSIKSDSQVNAIIVTGTGSKAFCTGMDLSDLSAEEADHICRIPRDQQPIFRLTAIQQKVWKPVVTAVNGMVCGGGFHFLADSDLVVAAEHATFFDSHVKVGLVAGLEPVGLARRIPLESVFRLAFLGGDERMSSDEAKSCGLVGEVLDAGQLLDRAMTLASTISRHSPAALARTKKAIWDSLNTGLDQALTDTWESILAHNSHPDSNEGARAFAEKRKPIWHKPPEL